MDEQDVVKGLQAGIGSRDYESAAKYVMINYLPMVIGLVMQNSGSYDDGKDTFQVVFIKFLNIVRNNNYEDKGQMRAFFKRIARNSWMDELENRKRQEDRDNKSPTEEEAVLNAVLTQLETPDADLPADFIYNDRWTKIHTAWKNWDETDCKDLLIAKYLGKIKSEELAELFGIEDTAMRQRLRRCREKFKNLLTKAGVNVVYLEQGIKSRRN